MGESLSEISHENLSVFDIIKTFSSKVKELKKDVFKEKEDLERGFVDYILVNYTEDEIKNITKGKNINSYIHDKLNSITIDNAFSFFQQSDQQKEKYITQLTNNVSLILSVIVSGDLNALINAFVFVMKNGTRKNVLDFLNSQNISLITNKKNNNTDEDLKKNNINNNTENKEPLNNIDEGLIDSVNKIFNKYGKWAVPIDAKTFISIMQKYWIPLELWLAQAIIESNIWTSGWRPTTTKNMFNVGNVDNWWNKYMNSREEWIETYAKLLKDQYSDDFWNINTKLLLSNDFKNKNWNKYATASDYTKKLWSVIENINTMMV